MATRNTTPPPDEGDTRTSGFSEEQRGELRDLIAEAVGGAKPPPAPKEKVGPALTDSEWDAMSDRQRESWVRKLVDFRLDELAREDEIARHGADIDALKNQKPEPEATPSVVTKLQRWLWGEPDK
jgi:hypothetical protein